MCDLALRWPSGVLTGISLGPFLPRARADGNYDTSSLLVLCHQLEQASSSLGLSVVRYDRSHDGGDQ